MIDLHTHSNKSDGTLSPKELVKLAKDMGLEAIALTDHDTMDGLDEARTEGKRLGVEIISGVELSTDYKGMEVHILGFCMEEYNPEFLKKLKEFADGRERRNEKMAQLLQKEGFDIRIEDLLQEYPESVITRAHFSRYLVDHGFVEDFDTVFREYLGQGCRCYVPRKKHTPFEAVKLIRLGKGVPVFAHPVLCHLKEADLFSLLKELKEAGLAGMEAIYSMNGSEDEKNLLGLAKELGLLVSGGSDFHGANKPHIQLGTGRGNLQIPYGILEEMKNWRLEQYGPAHSPKT